MRYAVRLERLERSATGGDADRPGAVCGVCGGLHALNVAQVVAAERQRTCECVRCGCAAFAAGLAEVMREYAG